ncbi:hypothetical protein OL229_04300 [Neisseriaceae bacterium JH1-16]|nr:hypothetical protein [Neisseriaceae bacterium JH1-16]
MNGFAWGFDPLTRECIGLVALQPDPLSPGEYFQRDNVTDIEPPAMAEHQVAVMVGMT